MVNNYVVGVILSILSGVVTNLGLLLVKIEVNKVPNESRGDDFNKILMKQWQWWVGQILNMGVGTVFFIMAQNFIGPSLVPGLMASGLIILAIGSVKLIGETLKTKEKFGILVMIIGIILISISGLAIPTEDVDIMDSGLLTRITIFTIISFILYFSSLLFGKKSKVESQKGIYIIIASGIALSISNFWICPLLVVIDPIFEGNFDILYIIIFLFAIVILVLCNIWYLARTQESMKFGQVNQLIPIQNLPIQISPIIIYFLVFSKVTAPINIIFIVGGTILVVISSFILGKRQAQLEEIQ